MPSPCFSPVRAFTFSTTDDRLTGSSYVNILPEPHPSWPGSNQRASIMAMNATHGGGLSWSIPSGGDWLRTIGLHDPLPSPLANQSLTFKKNSFSWHVLVLNPISQTGSSPTSSNTIIASSMRRVYPHTFCNCLKNNCLLDIFTSETLHGFEDRRVIRDDGANLSYSQLWSVYYTSMCELCAEDLTFGSDKASSRTWGVKSIVRKTLFACCCG